MTSEQIRADIDNLKTRLGENERQLKSAPDLENGLQLQRENTDLRAYQSQLERRLNQVVADEQADQEKQERGEQDRELAQITAENADTTAQVAHIVRELAPALQTAYEQIAELRDPLWAKRARYESVYLRRHNKLPESWKDPVMKSTGLVPDNAGWPEVGLLMELLDNRARKLGISVEDVYRGLSRI